MVNISQTTGGRPVVFLRFNPDNYKVIKGEHMCSKNKRLQHLLHCIHFLSKTKPTQFLQVMYLFFDYFRFGSEKLETLLSFD